MKGPVASLVPDRRSAPRHNLRIPLCLRTRDNYEMSEWQSVLESKNISDTGLLFASDFRLAPGTKIEVLMEIAAVINQSESTSRGWWSGEVVRLEPSDLFKGIYAIAVKFFCYEVLHTGKMETVSAC